MTAFSVPPAAKSVLELLCQLRDGPREDAWSGFVSVIASGRYEMLALLWEGLAKKLDLTITAAHEDKPTPTAIRESACGIDGRVAWRT